MINHLNITRDKPITIFWFRRDLRIIDNTGLYLACKENSLVLPIFIFDKNIIDELPVNDMRVSYIYSQIQKLNQVFLSYNSCLQTFYSTPKEAFEMLFEKTIISKIIVNEDYEPYGINRDKMIVAMSKKKGVKFEKYQDHVIMHPKGILKNDGTPYLKFTAYANQWLKKFEPQKSIMQPDLSKCIKLDPTTIINLNDIGFNYNLPNIFKPNLSNKKLKYYTENRNYPAINGTSKISIHLRFGTISIREAAYKGYLHSIDFLKELIWREFFIHILYHYPHVIGQNFNEKYAKLNWLNNEKEFEKWKTGQTGFAIIDAGINELNNTGYMHNRVRMIAANFLSKLLLIDWRWGEAYFAEKLLDYELSSNNGNWQWAAGTGCDAMPYFRIFNPETQTIKFDKNLEYIKTHIPKYKPETYIKPIINYTERRQFALQIFKTSIFKNT